MCMNSAFLCAHIGSSRPHKTAFLYISMSTTVYCANFLLFLYFCYLNFHQCLKCNLFDAFYFLLFPFMLVQLKVSYVNRREHGMHKKDTQIKRIKQNFKNTKIENESS